MSIGPLQAFIIAFPDNELLEGRIAAELEALSALGQIRIVDAVFATRDGDEVTIVSVSELDADERADLRSAAGALIGLGVAGADGAVAGAVLGASAPDDAPTVAEMVGDALADELVDASSALVLIIEHVWATGLRDAVLDAGGLVIARRPIEPAALVAAGALLGELAADDRALD